MPYRYKKEYPYLNSLIENLTQGFRSNLEPNLLAELCRFLPRVWDARSAYRETPIPDAGCGHKCGIGDDRVVEIER